MIFSHFHLNIFDNYEIWCSTYLHCFDLLFSWVYTKENLSPYLDIYSQYICRCIMKTFDRMVTTTQSGQVETNVCSAKDYHPSLMLPFICFYFIFKSFWIPDSISNIFSNGMLDANSRVYWSNKYLNSELNLLSQQSNIKQKVTLPSLFSGKSPLPAPLQWAF